MENLICVQDSRRYVIMLVKSTRDLNAIGSQEFAHS